VEIPLIVAAWVVNNRRFCRQFLMAGAAILLLDFHFTARAFEIAREVVR
jgi:hypothetical protein